MPDDNPLIVDPGRFTGEGAEISLLSFLRSADTNLDTLKDDDITVAIQPLHTLILRILVPADKVEPAKQLPKPGRPIRHLAARILVKLHKKVESRSLFDVVQALLKAVDGGGRNMSALENVQRGYQRPWS